MFTKIRLRNFRSFGDVELNLTTRNGSPKNLAIIFGENGAGKSNLMSAFVLLHELFSTMNVRDLYEELLSRQALYADEDMENRRRQRLKAGMRDIQAIIDDYRMVGCKDPICVEYDFRINGNDGKYCITLGENEIIHEKLEFLLSKRKGTYFDCTADSISINSNIVHEKALLNDIKDSAKRFWGKHSIISIIIHELLDKSKAYGEDNMSDNFNKAMEELTLISSYLGIGSRTWNMFFAPLEVLESPISGELSIDNENQLEIVENVFTKFFSSINSDIRMVYYTRTYNDKLVRYALVFEKLISGEYRQIDFSKESTGNHQLLRVLCFLLSACCGNIVVIDEADSGVHDYLFLKLLQEISPFISGQVIMTTHNTMLMEADFARNATYILSEEDSGHKVIRSISDYPQRTYLANNIRSKYMEGKYGGLPNVSKLDFDPLVKAIANISTV